MMIRTLFSLPCLLLAVSACSQQTPPVEQGKPPKKQSAEPAKPQDVLQELLASFKQEGITLDAKAQTVSIPAVVNQAQDPVEYLLIHRRGKKHEAVFWTMTKPSVLNGALLLLGLEPGKNATYKDKDPLPTLEEVQAGVDPLIITEPEGIEFYMTVHWLNEAKQKVEYCVEDLLLDLSTQQPLAACKWIYLGGRMASLYKGDPPEYMADLEGNLVSICYLTPDNHLATMAHEGARDDQRWWTTTRLPEPGTEVTFVFHRIEPEIHVERQKRILAESKGKDAAQQKAADKKDGAKQKQTGDGK